MCLLNNAQKGFFYPISNFAFIPMNDRVKGKFVRGLHKTYETKRNNMFIDWLSKKDQNWSVNKEENILRSLDYLKAMENMKPPYQRENRVLYQDLVPLTTNVNNKKTTVGIRILAGTKKDSIKGYTVTHPKYSTGHGTKALIETMSDYATNTPNLHHSINGATEAHNRLYNAVASKYNTPSNLSIAGVRRLGKQ